MPTSGRSRREAEPVRITTAPTNHREDLERRRKRYIISMSVRTACFVGAVLIDGWPRWIMVAAALILPYVAVVVANSEGPRIPGSDLVEPGPSYKELGR